MRLVWIHIFVVLLLACACNDAAQEPSTVAEGETQAGSTNRLIHEKSPYLLQHAYNPVDWYPWGEEAFERAQQENKPIFLSIGYSTCHWCHVMERESFEDENIASILNRDFISIKVDREERPDIDHVYMTFVQATTGRGGWPMSVWLTPDRKPFFGGTYFPPVRRGNRPGFTEVLQLVVQRWQNDPASITESADELLAKMRERNDLEARGDNKELNVEYFTSTYETLKQRFDRKFAGFGQAPKFPTPSQLLFLHRAYLRDIEPLALEMSVETLLAMADGGIHDQLAGGFHRYSTDAFWRLPHFEKMLYDQAQLVTAYLEAYQLTGNERLSQVARDICEYVLRDLTDEHGGFYSAEDADSIDPENPEEKLEGAFYVWRFAELEKLLTEREISLARLHYGAQPSGNLNSHELSGYNVLYVNMDLEEAADSLGVSLQEAEQAMQRLNGKLLQARNARPRPHLDDKVLTAWNGLMISGFARAAGVLQVPRYRTAAVRAADFVLDKLWDDDSEQLLRRYRDGESRIAAFNTDYAFFVQGLLDLYETTFDYRYLQWAEKLTERQIELFGDPESGGFFETTDADKTVLLRSKEDFDGAQPTSNSIAVLNLQRLAQILDSDVYRQKARKTLELFAPSLERFGYGLTSMMVSLDFHLAPHRQVIIAGEPEAEDTAKLVRTVQERFLPHKVLLLADGGKAQESLAKQLSIMKAIQKQNGRATAYVCEDYTCQLPVNEPEALAAQLDSK